MCGSEDGASETTAHDARTELHRDLAARCRRPLVVRELAEREEGEDQGVGTAAMKLNGVDATEIQPRRAAQLVTAGAVMARSPAMTPMRMRGER